MQAVAHVGSRSCTCRCTYLPCSCLPCGLSSVPATRRSCQEGGEGSCGWALSSWLVRDLQEIMKHLQKILKQLQKILEHLVVDNWCLTMVRSLLVHAATTTHLCSWTLPTQVGGPVVGSGTTIGKIGSGGMGKHLMPHTPILSRTCSGTWIATSS